MISLLQFLALGAALVLSPLLTALLTFLAGVVLMACCRFVRGWVASGSRQPERDSNKNATGRDRSPARPVTYSPVKAKSDALVPPYWGWLIWRRRFLSVRGDGHHVSECRGIRAQHR